MHPVSPLPSGGKTMNKMQVTAVVWMLLASSTLLAVGVRAPAG